MKCYYHQIFQAPAGNGTPISEMFTLTLCLLRSTFQICNVLHRHIKITPVSKITKVFHGNSVVR